jgi:copper homeostasis protein
MAIVSSTPEPMPLLEVTVLHPRDAEAAAQGEADRLLLVAEPARGGRTPTAVSVSAVVRETDLPVRVLLREDDPSAGIEEVAAFARTCLDLGAESVSFGYLDRDLEIDRDRCAAVAASLEGRRWSFHRGFDDALVTDRAWRQVLDLPAIDAVTTAGSTRGLGAGGEDLLAVARDPRVAALVLASGDLRADYVPWLLRAGVRQFGLGAEVRPDGSWQKAYVDVAAVRAWRLLLDDAHQRALGVPVD